MLALALAELRFMTVSFQLRSHFTFTADIYIIALFKSDKKFLDEKLFLGVTLLKPQAFKEFYYLANFYEVLL